MDLQDFCCHYDKDLLYDKDLYICHYEKVLLDFKFNCDKDLYDFELSLRQRFSWSSIVIICNEFPLQKVSFE